MKCFKDSVETIIFSLLRFCVGNLIDTYLGFKTRALCVVPFKCQGKLTLFRNIQNTGR